MANTRKIGLKEVEKHNSKKDVWIVLHNDVLDVTSFLAEHPGGESAIMDLAGKDASVAFEDAGHSHDAREMAAQYKIGWLPPPERRRFVDSCASVVSRKSSCTSKSGTSKDKDKKDIKKGKLQPRRKKKSPPPPQGSSKWKWALLVLAVAIVAGVSYKKFAK